METRVDKKLYEKNITTTKNKIQYVKKTGWQKIRNGKLKISAEGCIQS